MIAVLNAGILCSSREHSCAQHGSRGLCRPTRDKVDNSHDRSCALCHRKATRHQSAGRPRLQGVGAANCPGTAGCLESRRGHTADPRLGESERSRFARDEVRRARLAQGCGTRCCKRCCAGEASHATVASTQQLRSRRLLRGSAQIPSMCVRWPVPLIAWQCFPWKPIYPGGT
jgi:hypothetical protein